MNRITKALYKWIIPRLLKKECPLRIPRSGKAGEKADCFVIAVDNDSSPFLMINKFEKNSLYGFEWDGKSYSGQGSISLENINDNDLVITHFYGLSEVTYKGIYDYVINGLSRWPYIKIIRKRFFLKVYQHRFNKKEMMTQKRVDLLRFMIENQFSRRHKGISLIDLMTKLYSIKWVLHPNADKQREILQFYLDSLVSTGDLEIINHEYVVNGYAVTFIEQWEEDERKHNESVKLQRRAFWLSVVIAFLALVQANVIKLPTVIDLSSKEAGATEMHNKTLKRDAVNGAL